MLKGFKKSTWIWASVSMFLLFIPSFMASWAIDEGEIGSGGVIYRAFEKIYFVLTTPFLFLLGKYFDAAPPLPYFFALFLDFVFWGFLIERLAWIVKRRKP
jgi:hypothetical protein